MVMALKTKLLSPLVKVFADEEPKDVQVSKVEGFKNETVSFQLALSEDDKSYLVKIQVDSELKNYIRVRDVHDLHMYLYDLHMNPSIYEQEENRLLRDSPGLYPDLLTDTRDGFVYVRKDCWKAVWIDIEPSDDLAAGVYPVTIRVTDERNEHICTAQLTAKVLDAALPSQTLRHTKWFHADCLAEYYHLDAFSERHWEICENFIRLAVRRGINMILTPIFTLALDTAPGHERLTTQLVDISVDKGVYAFGFDKLKRWVDMCNRCGVDYFEFAHLFTQWGAKAAPKVMATVNGEYKRIFGWETDALGDEYKAFLAAFLPALTDLLKEMDIADVSYFHISDEPGIFGETFAQYKAVKAMVDPYLKEFKIIDAVSHIELFKSGGMDTPVPDVRHIHEFLELGMSEPWTYYCGVHSVDVPQLCVNMPSHRNRILGILLYKYGIEGFLHWGYNFYNSMYSYMPINPYLSLNGGGFGGNGDSYQVYPGPDGHPEESIRIMVSAHSMYDLRALQMLESLTDKAFVVSLIDEGAKEPITFTVYPREDEYILALRERVNSEIMLRKGQ